MGAKIIHCGGVGTGGAVKVSYRVASLVTLSKDLKKKNCRKKRQIHQNLIKGEDIKL